jgi:hypothetical protein
MSPSSRYGDATARDDAGEDRTLAGRRQPVPSCALGPTAPEQHPNAHFLRHDILSPPILRLPTNVLTRTAALIFTFDRCIPYMCSWLTDAYNYDALEIGLVLFSFGAGSMLGSVLGEHWSNRELRRLTHANGGRHSPEVQHLFSPSRFPPLTTIRDNKHAPEDALRKHETCGDSPTHGSRRNTGTFPPNKIMRHVTSGTRCNRCLD